MAAMRLHWVKDVRRSASLGHGRLDRWRLGMLHTRFALAQAVPRLRPGPTTAALAPDGHRMEVATAGELAVMHDVLLAREYEPRGEPQTIFDLGANVGFASLFLHRRFPGARIFSVEADPATHARLERNVGSLPGVTTLHRAVTGHDGPVRFFSQGESIGSSLVARPGAKAEVEVAGSTIASLMEELGTERIHLLKMDIEGAEFDALRAAPIDRVDEIIAEVHYDLGGGDERTVRELLPGFDLDFRPLRQPGRALVYGVR